MKIKITISGTHFFTFMLLAAQCYYALDLLYNRREMLQVFYTNFAEFL